MHANQDGFIGIVEAAKHLGVSVDTLRRYVRMRGVPYYQPGGRLLFRASELDAWMQRSRKGDRGMLLGLASNRRLA